VEVPGDTITLTVNLDHAITIPGKPVLTLSNGGTAVYSGGSGTDEVTFSYTVGSKDHSTSELTITGANLSDGTHRDLSGAAMKLSGVQIDTAAPADSPTANSSNAVALLNQYAAAGLGNGSTHAGGMDLASTAASDGGQTLANAGANWHEHHHHHHHHS